MSNIGKLSVDLRLDSQKFNASVKRARASLTRLKSRVGSVTKGVGGMAAGLAAAAGIAGLGAMISKSLDAGDAIAKMSDRLGISTEKLSAFQHMAQLNGESIEGFDKSIEKMVRSIGEAQRGLGTGKKAFEDLGISVDQLKGKNADQQFLIISDAISKLENEALQASMASDIFGRSGIKLINTIRSGKEGFEAASAEVDKFGLALSRTDAAKIEMANDAILRAKQSIKGAAMQATVQLAPIIEEVANRFVQAGTEGEGFGGVIRTVMEGGAEAIGIFADGIRGIHIILKAVEVAVKGFGMVWSTVIDFIVNKALVPFANSVTNLVLKPLREVLEFGAEYSDTVKDMLDSVNKLGKAEGFETLRTINKVMKDGFNESKGELQELMMSTLPSEAMKEKIGEIFDSAEERAKESAQNVSRVYREEVAAAEGATLENKDEKSEGQKLSEKKTYLERISALEINQSKKLARVKQAIKLKEVIANQWKAISEAVASAPFPYNVPAIAMATAETAAALSGIQSIGSFEGGGFTGRGPRVGGSDGRGGMNATVHPNEAIVDLTKQGGTGGIAVTMNNTFNGSPDDIFAALERQPRKMKRIISSLMYKPV